MHDNSATYIIGHLDWWSRLRFGAAVVLALATFGSLGWAILKPWDPTGAISLLTVDSWAFSLIRVTGLAVAVAVLATIILAGGFRQFGTFAASLGLLWTVINTGGMDYLLVRLQAGKSPDDMSSWGFLAFEMIAWTVPLAASVAASALTERWVRDDKNTGAKPPAKPVLRGIGSTVVTMALAAVIIAICCTTTKKGQVVFAVGLGFFVGSMVAGYLTETDRPVWHVVAAPLLGFAFYMYTWLFSDSVGGISESILHLPPNRLAGVLPVEYISVGVLAAVWGSWYSQRLVRYSKSNVK